MDNILYEVEPSKLFSESLIWQLNRDYYNDAGIEAWSKGVVPSYMTSNCMVGKTYAALILGLLKDLAAKGQTKDPVYILELGAGHGRLAFHILKHLDKLIAGLDRKLPPFCYVLSDIVEENLLFFQNHIQLQPYFERGVLDVAYYDAIDSKSLRLRNTNIKINAGAIDQPLIAIANYFFDSIPNDLFHIKDQEIYACSIALHSPQHPKLLETDELIKNLKLTFDEKQNKKPYYSSITLNQILDSYKTQVNDTYLFFPKKGIQCLDNLKALSNSGLLLLSMDKGFYDIADIKKKKKPEIITHGSFSLWVNYHALGAYCQKIGGKALFPSFSTFHLQMGCLMFLEEADTFQSLNTAYEQYVNDFGPDDFNSIKQMTYANLSNLSIIQLLAILRLGSYDSTLFLKILPRIKQVLKTTTAAQRERLSQSLDMVWSFYFNINEMHDMALNIAGMFFDMGEYQDALVYFQYSTETYGKEADTYYNKILCYYELRQDVLFASALNKAKFLFPESNIFEKLDKLDLKAV